MPDKKTTDLSALTGANLAITDLFRVVDVSDTTMAATGTNKKMTPPELTVGLGLGINVRNYGATGDARKVTDGVINSSTTVTSATAAFTSADVGKVIWGVETSTGIARLLQTTIASVTNSTTIVVASAASTTTTGISLILGTDDTAALQAAVTAAKITGVRSRVVVPSGGYIFSGLPFDCSEASATSTVGIVGGGSSNTIFYPAPSYDFGTTTSNNGFFWRANGGTNQNALLQGVKIDGSSYSWAGASGYHVISDTGDRSTIVDVRVSNCKGFTAHCSLTGTHGKMDTCYFEGASYVGLTLSGGGYNFFNTYSGNHAYLGWQISSVTGSGNTGIAVKLFGCLVDECGSGSGDVPSLLVESSTDVLFVGCRIFSGSNQYAASLTSSAEARFVGCEIVAYGASGNRGGLKVATGCTATLSCNRLTSIGTGYYGLNNAGTVYDALGNVINTLSGSEPLVKLRTLPTSDPAVSGVLYTTAGAVMQSA